MPAFEVSSWPKSKMAPRPVSLEANRIDFEGFVFPGDAIFDRASFIGDAYFKAAVFSGTASFDKAQFSGATLFQHAVFLGPAAFDGASFFWHAYFQGTSFPGGAWFTNAYFRRTADFGRAVADGAFSLAGARFDQTPPNFLSARLAEPPVFEKLRISASAEPGLFIQSVIGGFFLWIIRQLEFSARCAIPGAPAPCRAGGRSQERAAFRRRRDPFEALYRGPALARRFLAGRALRADLQFRPLGGEAHFLADRADSGFELGLPRAACTCRGFGGGTA